MHCHSEIACGQEAESASRARQARREADDAWLQLLPRPDDSLEDGANVLWTIGESNCPSPSFCQRRNGDHRHGVHSRLCGTVMSNELASTEDISSTILTILPWIVSLIWLASMAFEYYFE
mmetsp:Transcript_9733/g.27982  ORF Transcript_9733/g.27982 Transcript_9733/m.27982 type:complete len:120 (+) Transcript_9733:106-465(+)